MDKVVTMLIPLRKKNIIFGAGGAGESVLRSAPLNFAYIVDNDKNKEGQYVLGCPVKSPEVLSGEDKNDIFIVVAHYTRYDEIAKQLCNLGFETDRHFADFREIGLELVPKITSIRVNVTRKCNSRCRMCNLWQETNPLELSPEELGGVLKDPFFKNVNNLYITGGEPIVLADFSEYVKVAIGSLPRLNNVSTVVNGLLPEKTVKIIGKCKKICDQKNISFNCSVSIDGFEFENDAQRGVPGSFNKAMSTICALNENGINVTASTTITKINLPCLNEFFDFLESKNITGNFKLGIKAAFFNNEETKNIFDFDEDETFFLKKFFLRIAKEYEEKNRFGYFVAINQLHMLCGSERLLDCGYAQRSAASITETGQLRFCCSKSKDLGSVVENYAWSVFDQNIEYLEFLKHTSCLFCNADALSWASQNMGKLIEEEKYWNDFYNKRKYKKNIIDLSDAGDIFGYDNCNVALMVGVYGNESVFDVAVLGWFVKQISNRFDKIIVASSEPFVTEYHVRRNDIGVDVINVKSENFAYACRFAKEVFIYDPQSANYPWVEFAGQFSNLITEITNCEFPIKSFNSKKNSEKNDDIAVLMDLNETRAAYELGKIISENPNETLKVYATRNTPQFDGVNIYRRIAGVLENPFISVEDVVLTIAEYFDILSCSKKVYVLSGSKVR
jgi:MoaA/NifB/PqqE/SkfB family radical SAM enzyme